MSLLRCQVRISFVHQFDATVPAGPDDGQNVLKAEVEVFLQARAQYPDYETYEIESSERVASAATVAPTVVSA